MNPELAFDIELEMAAVYRECERRAEEKIAKSKLGLAFVNIEEESRDILARIAYNN